MTDLRAIADRVEIDALRAEFTDAPMMRDYDRLAALFTEDAVWSIPAAGIELTGRDTVLTWFRGVPDRLDFLVQNSHPGSLHVTGDTATGRTFVHEVLRQHDGTSHTNLAIYHDRYHRTPTGWRYTERTYEIRYLDPTPLPGKAPHPLTTPAHSPHG